ncbi:MAG: methyltransferase domain-containing protein [Actinomycetota bacterium]|nr:methyltransferase domain-containing protein [Actinomycetota bacterium]
MVDAAEQMKDRNRLMWSLGDYPTIADFLRPAARAVADACSVGPGMSVLDVGAGTGNFAVEAAKRGARVIASDLTPHLIELGRARTEQEMLDIEWHEADAEDLPFEDEMFDVTASVFGAIFAPHADKVVAEMMRVTRPGGVVAMTSWDNDGYAGQIATMTMEFAPPPPEGVDRPTSWGTEEAARARFEPVAEEVNVGRGTVTWDFASSEEAREAVETKIPPVVAAKMVMPPERFEEMMTRYDEIQRRFDRGEGGRVAVDSEYLLILARKPS